MFGKPWRKRTRFMFANVDLAPAIRHCHGRGICDRSGHAHVELTGTQKGVFMTLIAEPYPPKMCSILVRCFANAMCQRAVSRLLKYICPE
jgi:hypothetical protein